MMFRCTKTFTPTWRPHRSEWLIALTLAALIASTPISAAAPETPIDSASATAAATETPTLDQDQDQVKG